MPYEYPLALPGSVIRIPRDQTAIQGLLRIRLRAGEFAHTTGGDIVKTFDTNRLFVVRADSIHPFEYGRVDPDTYGILALALKDTVLEVDGPLFRLSQDRRTVEPRPGDAGTRRKGALPGFGFSIEENKLTPGEQLEIFKQLRPNASNPDTAEEWVERFLARIHYEAGEAHRKTWQAANKEIAGIIETDEKRIAEVIARLQLPPEEPATIVTRKKAMETDLKTRFRNLENSLPSLPLMRRPVQAAAQAQM